MRSHSVGYYSSYDRGLLTLLEMWPEIREAVPDASLDIFYGWEGYDSMHRNNPTQMKWKWQMVRLLADLKPLGVTERGRVSHEELAAHMKRTKVWAYPTTFAEISCITAMKAQAAGMIPVTTGCYALAETILDNKYTVKTDEIDTDEAKREEFIQTVIKALKSSDTPDPKPAIEKFNWTVVAKQWDEALS
jgi:glycosyltransferase involved in cell wall biosynthesis